MAGNAVATQCVAECQTGTGQAPLVTPDPLLVMEVMRVSYHIVTPSECTGGGIARISQACCFLNTELQVHDHGVFIQDVDLHKSKAWICNRHVSEICGAGMILSAQ